VSLVVVGSVLLPIAVNLSSDSVPARLMPPQWVLLLLLVALVGPLVYQRVRSSSINVDVPIDENGMRHAASVLADAVRDQWVDEAGVRGLRQPEPLRVSWSTTRRPVVTHPATVFKAPDIARWPARTRSGGDIGEIVARFRSLPRRQVVVLGAPGSGKSVLALMLTVGLLEDARSDEPVPVLVSLASWRPSGPGQEHFHLWLSRRMHQDYPFLANTSTFGRRAALALIRSRRIMPVLDGLDEMPPHLQPAALEEIDRAIGERPVVLTSRGDEFERAAGQIGDSVLSTAAVVELEPVSADESSAFLTRGVRKPDRWGPLERHLEQHPDGPLATALHSPLMVWLVRRTYAAPTSTPAELLHPDRFADTDAIERHLLDGMLAGVYDDRPPAPARSVRRFARSDATRWLRFLAASARRSGGPEIAWWRVKTSVPRWVGAAAGGLIGATIITLPATALGLETALAVLPITILVAASQWRTDEGHTQFRTAATRLLAGSTGGAVGGLLLGSGGRQNDLLDTVIGTTLLGVLFGLIAALFGFAAGVPRRVRGGPGPLRRHLRRLTSVFHE
jgi:hypothetical protein